MIVTKGSNDTSEHDRTRCGIVPRTETNREEGGPGMEFPKESARPQPCVEGLSNRMGHSLERASLSLHEGHPEETDRDLSKRMNGNLRREDLVLGAASDRHLHAFLGNCEVRSQGCTRAPSRQPLGSQEGAASCFAADFLLLSRWTPAARGQSLRRHCSGAAWISARAAQPSSHGWRNSTDLILA